MTRVVRLTPRDSDTAANPRLGSAALSPFHFTSNPMLSWLAGPYGDILTELRTGVVGGAGALVLTGEVGSGKTMLANTVAEFLRPNGVAIGRIDYPSDNTPDFCRAVGEVFGWQDVRSETFFPRAQQFLEETHARDARALLIVEEAQRVGRHVLAHIAQLVNLSRRIGGDQGSPLTVMLVGQDDLTAVLDSPENAAMKSVVKARYRLRPLTEDEVQRYIQHQLIIANAPRDLFTPQALKRVAEISRGIPRVINTLCHRAVIEAAQQGVSSIGPKLVRTSVEELVPARGTGSAAAEPAPATAVTAPSARTSTRKTRRGERAAIAVVVLLVAFLGGYVTYHVRRDAAVVKSAAPPTPQPLSSTQTPALPPSTEALPRLETSASQSLSVPPTPPVEAPRPAAPASAPATNPPATQEQAVVRPGVAAPAVPTPTAPAPTPAPPRSTEIPPRLETWASQPRSVPPTPPVEAPRPTAPTSARATNPPATQERAVVRPAVPTPTAPAPTPAPPRAAEVPPRLETSASQPFSMPPTPPVEAPRPAPPAPARATNPPAPQERALVRPALPAPTAPAPTPAQARPAPAREPSAPPGGRAEPDPTAVIDWLLRNAPRRPN